MEPVYVVGHQNPDTDSIVSAIAYAALRNALGDREFVAARLGEPSDQTQLVLERFGFAPPMRLHTLRTQVSDLNFDVPPILSAAVSVGTAWQIAREADTSATSLPITDEAGRLFGMISQGDMAEYVLRAEDAPAVDIPLFNLLSALDGRLACDYMNTFVHCSGIVIALPGAPAGSVYPGCVLVCGDQPEVLIDAKERGASCAVICSSDAPKGDYGEMCVISTQMDAYRAARMIYMSVPVSRVCHTENIVSFRLDDFVDNVREKTLETRYRSYPIIDAEGKVAGELSRYHLLRPKRKRVVLVDHNEMSQSVPGLEQAEILEIIDHHRLADVQTGAPIFFRNEPVGSTATIIAGMFQDRGIMPSPRLAGLMAAAVISDTVMFKSPTSTEKDVRTAERLARIADISLKDLAKQMFAVSANADADASELLHSDFKEFRIGGHSLGIGQITCLDSREVLARKDELLNAMREAADEHAYNMTLLMLTDVLRDGSELLVLGDPKVIKQAFGVDVSDDEVFLPGVMSRKKQIVPALSQFWG